MKRGNHTIRLSGVEPDKIDKQYGFRPLTYSNMNSENIPIESTKIVDLDTVFGHNVNRTDELKNNHSNKISLIDVTGLRNVNCFWDKHPFSGNPVFCPIDKESSPKIKEYLSHINGKKYKIQDSINNYEEQKTSYMIDSVFCSIECALAYLEDNSHDINYKNSYIYMKEIYNFSDKKTAPHWRLLIPYGGPMNINEFRKSFLNITYIPDGILFQPVCFLFVENYHL